MIKQLLIACGLFFLVTSFISKKKQFIPPGTVKINDTLFADETEVSNFSWLEYELWVKTKYGLNSPEHIASLPDTLVWREKNSYNEPYVKYYYRHPAYKNYPVVGISYEQACNFVKWRMERVKEFMCISGKYGLIQFEYRLPTKSEWEFLSNNGNGILNNGGKNGKGMVTFNHCWAADTMEIKKGYQHNWPDVTAPVHSYSKNYFGLYNMFGNVSEMVMEKGVSKGGGWRHQLEQCRPGKDITYEKPMSWLGFRCVCIVRKSRV